MTDTKVYLAHSNPEHPTDIDLWEPLLTREGKGPPGHIDRVTELCKLFASKAFQQTGATDNLWLRIGELIGRWHDLGKFSDAFQNYLRSAGGDSHEGERSGRVDHSSAGAQHAMAALPAPFNAMLAYCIAGHHAGLLDGNTGQKGCLIHRISKDVPAWRSAVPSALLNASSLDPRQLTQQLKPGKQADIAFQLGFATRMLFSCLVDADFLATESFMAPRQAAERPNGNVDFKKLDDYFTRHLDERFIGTNGTVAKARARVLSACRNKGEGEPGLYALTVPTGGGKTLSSLAFALRHCSANGLDRVIYAIPFTSIIEQTADVFRETFADYPTELDELILEHHSNFDPDKETTRTRLASENWDAPLIVTTNVQLFESLFANKPSRCRKLHSIAGSVIILDEAQTLPVTLLQPCLKVLQILVEQYHCTVVLCTATQPAIEQREGFEIGLSKPIPIIDDAPGLYRTLKRVNVRQAGKLDCTELAEQMVSQKQGLAIINTRKHAAALYDALKQESGTDGCYHLSAAMTPEHRSRKLGEIRQLLKTYRPCHVVATQLIEAGVDVDFPVVWRALAGLDSIAQAAGRCNREGKLSEAVTWAFEPVEEDFVRLFGSLRTARDAASQVIASGRHNDLLGLEAIEHYFQLHYWSRQQDWDKHGICNDFRMGDHRLPLDCEFATIAQKFRFIDDSQRPIVVGWDETAAELVDELRRRHHLGLYPDRKLARRLQRQTVSVSQRLWQSALGQQTELLCDRYAVLIDPRLHYHPELGLRLDADPLYDPNTLIID